MLKYKNIKTIKVSDWDDLVEKTYGKPYRFQQQDGCRNRGVYDLTIPCEEDCDEEMNNTIPEQVNGEIMGVKFCAWLARDPKRPLKGDIKAQWNTDLFWYRNFYPCVETIANDLYKKGLIETGEYRINIDW